LAIYKCRKDKKVYLARGDILIETPDFVRIKILSIKDISIDTILLGQYNYYRNIYCLKL
jgi:hypothetical protein